MRKPSSKDVVYEHEILEDEAEDIEDIEDIEEEIDDEEIDDEDIDDEEEDLLEDLEEYDDEILEDLDEYINDIDESDGCSYDVVVEEVVEKRTSFNILTKYEKNFIVGFRTQQIINGSVILIDVNKLKDKSAYSIAKQELVEKRIPFKVKRHFPNGKIEIWDLEDLIIL